MKVFQVVCQFANRYINHVANLEVFVSLQIEKAAPN